MTSSKSRFR